MESQEISLNLNRMQRTATLAREVLERARTRKLHWPSPRTFQRRTFQEGEDARIAGAFTSVAEHMRHMSAECENHYCCVSPFQFKEYEVAHIFRYHSRESSENLLKAFENEESKDVPIVEEPGCPDTDTAALIPAENAEHTTKASVTNVARHFAHAQECSVTSCAEAAPYLGTFQGANGTLERIASDIYIDVSPGTYTVSASSYDNTIKQTHLVDVRSGESINLTFDL